MDFGRASTTDGLQQLDFYNGRLPPVSAEPPQPSTFNSISQTLTMPSRLPQDPLTLPTDEPPQHHLKSTSDRPSVRFFMKPNFSDRKSPFELLQQMVPHVASVLWAPNNSRPITTSDVFELLPDRRDREPFHSIRYLNRASADRSEFSGKSRQWPLPYSTLCNGFHVSPPLSGKLRQRTPLHSP